MKKVTFIYAFIIFVGLGCGEQNEDVTQYPGKDGGIETILTTQHGKGCDLLITTHRAWVNGKCVKTFHRIDTIPDLGNTSQVGEDVDGNEKTVVIPKDWEFFITVQ